MNASNKDLILSYLSLAPIDDLVRFYEASYHDYLYLKFDIETPRFIEEAYADMPSPTEFLEGLLRLVTSYLKSKIKPHFLKYRDSNIYKMLYDIQHYNANPKTLIIQWDEKTSFSVYDFFRYFLESEMNKSIVSVAIKLLDGDDPNSPYYIIGSTGGLSSEIRKNLKNSELLSYLSNQNFDVFVHAMMMRIIHGELEHFPSLRGERGTFIDENGLGFYPFRFLFKHKKDTESQ
jgi:hypothetical protein